MMAVKGWKYYNHAMIPNIAPHEDADVSVLADKTFWKKNKSAFLARWTTEFDLKEETSWWYVIKDTPFDINSLKAKRRYEINKGLKNFTVKQISPRDYKKQIYDVQVAAFSAYPEKYRHKADREKRYSAIDGWNRYITYGAFSKENGEFCGYAFLGLQDNCLHYYVHKTNPHFEKLGINAAIVNQILTDFDTFLRQGGYLCDGTRNISHETSFQDYLEKYFEFRKAYCRLNLKYNPKIKWLVGVLYRFRHILAKFDGFGKIHNINAVLKMEEIIRNGSVAK